MNPTVTFHVGDVLDVLRSMPANSVDLVLSSPPFLALRSYLPADHPDKGKEIGSEPTPGEFVDTILDVIEACDRVLTPHGTLVFEFGDTYAGSGGGGGDLEGGWREGQAQFAGSAASMRESNAAHWRQKNVNKADWPLDKSLCLIPQIVTFALSYGFNPLTGRQTDRWRIRNVHPWCRPNPPVGALGDKWRPATSYLFSATKSRTRFFDLDAVRTESKEPERDRAFRYGSEKNHHEGSGPERQTFRNTNAAGAPPLDYIVLPTAPYSGSHYAVWPPKLLTPFILSMSPEKVCVECGEPSRRIVDVSYEKGHGGTTGKRRDLKEPDGRTNGTGFVGKAVMDRHVETLGWTDCGHNNYRPGVVLDPFAGSGTTLMVAAGLGRSAVGIDLDERNVGLAQDRLGLFAPEVIHHNAPAAFAEALYDVELPA